MRTRNNRVVVCLDDIEIKKLDKKVAASGLNRTAFLRKMIAEVEIKVRPSSEMYELLSELRRIGNNLNQIAAKAYSLNFIDAAAYQKNVSELQSAVGKIMKEVF